MMAHPYQKYRERHPGRARVKHVLKADGGGIDENIDVRSKEEMPTSVGPYGLGTAMRSARDRQDIDEANQGKRFLDYGSRIPGSMRAKQKGK